MKIKRPILLRWPQRLVRAAAWAVLLTFSANIVTPTLVLARESERRAELMAGPKRTQFDDVTDTLVQLEEALQRMNRRLQGGWEFEWQEIANRGGQTPPPAAADRAALRALEDELDAAVPRLESLQGHVRAFFAQTRKHIEDARLAPEILARHDDSVSEYDASYGQLKSLLHAIKTAHTPEEFKAAVAAGDAFMQAHSSKPRRSTFDPSAPLAFGPGKSTAREPATDAKAMRKALGIAEPTAKVLARQADTKAAPTAAELAETEDAQFTPAIRAKAQELGNSPVAIYNFVRNNVEFMPTYGSIQGADQTLKTLRGNAFDQSSLLIALLRAANVPARYVFGTVEVPIEQVQNWVGGTDTPQAALELLGAGGIPNLGLAQGGVIKKARIEHVWVETFVDFVPSRGAKNIAGDTWVPMDAAFKTYVQAPGMQLWKNVSMDGQTLLQELQAGSAGNEAEGWVSGINREAAARQATAYVEAVRTFVESRKADAKIAEVLGGRTINAASSPTLSIALPHSSATPSIRMSVLPDNARWKFRYAADDQVMLERSLPQLAGKSLALSFKAATTADQNALQSLLPADADGPEDIPTSIPTSVARLISELSVDGEVIATGPSRQLGSEISTRKGLYIPGKGWSETDNPLVVGNYQAIGLDGAGFAREQIAAARELATATKARLDAGDVAGLDKHDLTGFLLQSGLMSYFSETLTKSQLAADANGMIHVRLPSYGTVSTDSQVQYWFGVPRSFIPRGAIIDMDRMASASIAKDGNQAKWKSFNQAIGNLLSAHEHSVFEDLFDDRNASNGRDEGLSAVKALAVAAEAGQRTYMIRESNLASALGAISLPQAVENEIANAVQAGYTVVTHQQEVTFANQKTAGYVILDEDTGSAAYKLSNGTDGGAFWFTLLVVAAALCLAALALYGAIITGAGLLMIGLWAWAFIWMVDTALDWVDRMGQAQNSEQFNQAAIMAVLQSIAPILAVLGIGIGILGAGAAAALAFLGWFVRIWDCTWYDGEVPWCLA